MTIRNLLIATLSAGFSLATLPTAALAQDAPQCTLEQISEALNQLDCAVSGAFVSPASLVKTITTACEQTAQEETCHACFRRSGGKIGPALKALAKVKVFPKSSLSEFRVALVTAEETTCAAKEQPEDSRDDTDDSYQTGQPGYQQPDDSKGRGRGRGRGQDDATDRSDRFERPKKPERPERPQRPERKNRF